jgi:hypothetical protein
LIVPSMSDLCRLIWYALIGLFRSRAALEVEILVLRHQLNILRRKSPKRVALSSIDRLLLVGLYRLAPGVVDALMIIRPETLMRWHRAGFRAYWRWKSRPRGGRPTTPADIRRLIREMSVANPLWGAPRIHGELLKLGIDVGQTTVAKYMARRRRPPYGRSRRRCDGCRSPSLRPITPSRRLSGQAVAAARATSFRPVRPGAGGARPLRSRQSPPARIFAGSRSPRPPYGDSGSA